MNVFLQSAMVLSGLVCLAGLAAGIFWALGRIRGHLSLGLMMLGIIMFGSALVAFTGPQFNAPLAQPEG